MNHRPQTGCEDPTLSLGDIQHTSQHRELAIDAGDRSLSFCPSLLCKSRRAELAHIVVSHRAQAASGEVVAQNGQLALGCSE